MSEEVSSAIAFGENPEYLTVKPEVELIFTIALMEKCV